MTPIRHNYDYGITYRQALRKASAEHVGG